MCGIVTFDPAAFVLRYPEFSAVSSTLLNMYFTEATMYCNNTLTSPITDLQLRTILLNMLVAHIAAINGQLTGGAGNGLVGRIDQATEGSISAHATMGSSVTNTAAWYQQTQYGASYWSMTRPFRTMRYRARPFTPYAC